DHWRPHLSITRYRKVIHHRYQAIILDHGWGRDLYVNNTDLSPFNSCTLLCMALHSRASVKHTHSTQ
ncbi:unnamed protein product, partial [Staurois parvus]